MNVAKALREGRERLGLQQNQLAGMLNITPGFLNDIEHGRRAFGVKYINRLPDGLRQAVAAALLAEKEAEKEAEMEAIRRAL